MVSPSIVVGVDFSAASRRAMRGAAVFAQRSGLRLVLVHAFPARAGAKLAGAARRRVASAVRIAEVDEAGQLSKWADGLRAGGATVEVVAREGKPVDLLLGEAKRQRAGLIVLGTTGKGLLARAFLGGTARRVAERAPVPVLLYPQRGRALRGKPGPVVVGVDLGDGSGPIVDAGAALAKDLGAQLHVVYGLQMPLALGDFQGGATGVYTPEMLEGDELEAAEGLTEVTEHLRADLPVRNHVEVGDPGTALLTHARRVRASCIVAGRRRARRAGFGSVSAALVQRADRPVLIVPTGKAR